ncbi:MAG: VanZ family protein [Candidatus Aminicenantes bacterium]|nr:VanZ family protein [Candidatus Aminicenantes bacterium]
MNFSRKIVYFLPAAVYCALMFFLSSKSLKIKLGFIYWDKGAHWLEFMILGFLLAFGFFNYFPGKTFLNSYLTLMIGILIGLTDELHQLFVPGRQCDWRDWIADITGVVVGLALFWFIDRRLGRQLSSRKITG